MRPGGRGLTTRPPPAVLLLTAYGAGLATGLARFPEPVCALVVLLGAGLLLLESEQRWSVPAWLLNATLAAGALAGGLAQAAERGRCVARLPEGDVTLEARLLEPAGLDEARVALEAPGCGSGVLLARWPRARALAEGTPMRVRGRWLPRAGLRADGTLLVHEAVAIGPAQPSFASRLRGAAMRTSHRLYGPRAPLVDALVLGRRGGLDPALVQAFAASGLVHLLSISGFHVGVVVAWLVLGLRAIGLTPSRALLAASAAASAYVVLLGWPAPAARAALLAWLLAHGRMRQRPATDGTALALTCLAVLLFDPWAIADLGGWLSATALWGATRFGRWGDRVTGRGWLSRTTWSSVGATLGTAPVAAAMLGSVAPVGIVLNFAAIPIGALAVPGVLASLLLTPLPGAGEALAAGSGLLLALLERIALAGAALPGAGVTVPTGVWTGIAGALALAAACWATPSGRPGREAGRRAALLAAVTSWVFVAAEARGAVADGPLRLFFFDVGQGDAAAIRTPHGRWIVVDAGPADDRFDAGARVVAPALRRLGARTVDLLVVSHAHADHVGGAAALLRQLPTAQVLEPGEPVDDPRYRGFLEAVAAGGSRYGAARDGQSALVDGVQLTILHPAATWAEWGLDLNEDSAVLLLEYGAFRAVFAGDAGLVAEARLRGRIGDVTLLKAGHHGSRTASGTVWLQELRPEVAVLSVGRRNRYGHPTVETLQRLREVGARIRRTDADGTVIVTTDGRSLTVTGRTGTDSLPLPPPTP